jgi:hypothetical protein
VIADDRRAPAIARQVAWRASLGHAENQLIGVGAVVHVGIAAESCAVE